MIQLLDLNCPDQIKKSFIQKGARRGDLNNWGRADGKACEFKETANDGRGGLDGLAGEADGDGVTADNSEANSLEKPLGLSRLSPESGGAFSYFSQEWERRGTDHACGL